MKKLFLIFFLTLSVYTHAQQYVDLLRTYYETVDRGDYGSVNYQSLKLKLPIPINKKVVIITGIDQDYHFLKDVNPPIEKLLTPFHDQLISFRLQLGTNLTLSEKWKANLVALPKYSASVSNINGNAYQIGGWAVWSYKKTNNFSWRVGAYGSTEKYGWSLTPILGLYYLSEKKTLEVNAYLPMFLDINTQLHQKLRAGLTLRATNVGFAQGQYQDAYYHVNTRDILPYLQISLLDESLILQTAFVYAIKDYSLFENHSAIPSIVGVEIGEERTTVQDPTTDFHAGVQFRLVYRFHIKNEE